MGLGKNDTAEVLARSGEGTGRAEWPVAVIQAAGTALRTYRTLGRGLVSWGFRPKADAVLRCVPRSMLMVCLASWWCAKGLLLGCSDMLIVINMVFALIIRTIRRELRLCACHYIKSSK